MEWMALNEKIDRYISAHAFDTEATEDDPLFDWKAYIANMEEAIENFTKEGNEEMARAYRESLEEAKKYGYQYAIVETPPYVIATIPEALKRWKEFEENDLVYQNDQFIVLKFD